MSVTLSRPVRRMVALSILTLLLWLGWTVLLEPVLALPNARQADITTRVDQLVQLRTTIARKAAITGRATEVDRALAVTDSFWSGPTPSAVSASIQTALRPAIEAGGGQVQSISDVGETSEHGFRQIAVHFQIEGAIGTIPAALMAVETAKPSLFVESLIITSPEITGSRDRAPNLSIDLIVAGYARSDITGPGRSARISPP